MTKLKAKKPSTIEKRLKLFMYGAPGSGKTTAAISFPNVYMLDCERGSENDSYIKLLEKNNSSIMQVSSFQEIYDQVRALGSEQHDYRTLVIDPITTVYNRMLDEAARERISDKDADGTAFGGHYGTANKRMKSLLDMIMRLDMNVIVTAHSKNEYGQNLAVLGQTFDGYKKLDYLFDLVLEIQKRGKQRMAVVKKTRIEAFPEGEALQFSYDDVATRYGKDIIEKGSIPEPLATTEQITEFHDLAQAFNLTPAQIEKCCEKCGADCVSEMTSAYIQKCINELKSRIKGDIKYV